VRVDLEVHRPEVAFDEVTVVLRIEDSELVVVARRTR
jgi:hypothetical protein